MRVLGGYKNGNYRCVLFSDGTKVRHNNLDFFEPDRPESMDITISTYCEMGCEFCYAGCSKNGKHADIMSHSFIDNLEPYTELALNGNEPLHPDLIPFLYKCKGLNLIPSLTVNQYTFMKNIGLLKRLSDDNLIYGLGISLKEPTDEFVDAVKEFPNAVIHVINGIVTVEQMKKLAHNNLKILILGYKTLCRGEQLYEHEGNRIDALKQEFYDTLPVVINEEWFEVVSFDNLAIKQLDPKRLMSKKEWDEFYMGDDGSFTMYVDLVKQEYAKSSTSTDCWPLENNIKTMFDKVREVS